MSGVIAWVKSHLLIVVSILVIVLVLPGGWFGSSIMNKGVKEQAQKAYNDEKSALSRSESVTYTLPRVLNNEEPVETRRAPNRRVTEFLSEIKEQRDRQVGEVVERATAFNSGDAELLIEGLFPDAESDLRRRELVRQLARTFVGAGGREGAYQRLVRRLGGGEPTDAADVLAILNEQANSRRELMGVATTDRSLTSDQQETLQNELTSQRLGLYAGRAADLTFYTQPGVFEQAGLGGSPMPTALDTNQPASASQAFIWQWDYWAIGDVLRAIAAANSDASGPLGVADSAVKRLDAIWVSPMDLPAAGQQDDGFGGSRGAPAGGGSSGPPSHTGRSSGSSSDYDVRVVTVRAIVAPERMPALFDALGRTNFMTVTGVDLTEIDPWALIDEGYFFGSDHVMEAVIRIETVWLRSWTGPLMPEAMREALGVVLPEPESGEGEEGFGDDGFDDGGFDEDPRGRRGRP